MLGGNSLSLARAYAYVWVALAIGFTLFDAAAGAYVAVTCATVWAAADYVREGR